MHKTKIAELSHPALAAIMLCVLVAGLDHSIINVALPILGRDLNIAQSGLQWVVAGYAVAFTAGLLVAGRLSDRFGRKKMLLVGIVGFMAAAIYAALAATATQLTLGRILMGVGGTLLLPSTLAIISSQASDKQKPHLIGMWSAVFGMGIALGPLIGGLLLNHFSWSSIFWVNVPLLVLAAVLTVIALPETHSDHKPALRIFDGLLSAAAIGGIVMAIIEAPTWGLFNMRTLAYGLGGLAFLAWFLWRQRTIQHPLLDLTVFENRAAALAITAITLFTAAFAGTIFLVVQYAELVSGFSALKAGALFAPVAIGLVIGSIGSVRIQQKHSPKAAITAGTVLALLGLSLVVLSSSVTLSPWWISAMLAVSTLGLGMATAAATTIITGALPKHEAGMASALNDLSREIGSSIGVAALGSLAAWKYGYEVKELVGQYAGTPLASAVTGGLPQLKSLPADLIPTNVSTQTAAAFVSGTRVALVLAIAIVAILLVLMIRYMPAVRVEVKPGEAKRWFVH
jgi:MFS transporter, DHA2 family, multidrug resistance protein